MNEQMENVVAFERSGTYLRRKAAENRREGRYADALTLLYLARGKTDFDASLEMEIAEIMNEMGCCEESNQILLRLLQRGEMKGECLYAIASNYLNLQDPERARHMALMCLAEEPEGEFSLDAQDVIDAAEEMLEQTDAKSEHSEQLLRRGLRALEQGQAERAQRLLQRAVKTGGGAEALTVLSFCHLMQEDTRRALSAAVRAHAAAPHDIRTQCARACARFASGDRKEAVKILQRAEREHPEPPELMLLCQSACDMGLDAMAYRQLRALSTFQPYAPRVQLMLSVAALNLGHVREAARALGPLCRLFPQNPVYDAYFRIARERLERGDEQPPAKESERLPYSGQPPQGVSLGWLVDLGTQLVTGAEELRARIETDDSFYRVLEWLLHVQLPGTDVWQTVLRSLSRVQSGRVKGLLCDMLTDASLADEVKREAMTALGVLGERGPLYADIDGRMVRMTVRTGVSQRPLSQSYERVLQAVVERLTPIYGDVGEQVADIWTAFVQREGPQGAMRRPDAWMAALEYVYHQKCGRQVSAARVGRMRHVPPRMIKRYAQRILPKADEEDSER